MHLGLDHYNFITRTDRKSLCTQIHNLVGKAREVAKDELQQRRHKLRHLLEYESAFFEEEFTNKVKSRIDDNIIERKNALVKIKEENERSALVFLEKKRVQQQMENCYEVREALRYKNRQNVRECQLEQILEKERNFARECQIDAQWQEMQRRGRQRVDDQQMKEDCLKRRMQEKNSFMLGIQLQEHEEKRAEENALKQKEKDDLARNMEQLRLEKFDKLREGPPKKAVAYSKGLLAVADAKKAASLTEDKARIEVEKKILAELRQLEVSEKKALHARKHAAHQSMVEFIAYTQRLRDLEQTLDKSKDDRIDDLEHVDRCTKNNIQRARERRAEKAALCYAELRKQMCEMVERRMREEAAESAYKQPENRFARQEMTRAELLEQRRRNRADLDKQIAELERIRAAEEVSYRSGLMRAIDDPEYCAELAKQYMLEGRDYLEPHPNWQILACPTKQYVRKAPGPSDGAPCPAPTKAATCRRR